MKKNKKRFRALATAVETLEVGDDNEAPMETLDDFMVEMLQDSDGADAYDSDGTTADSSAPQPPAPMPEATAEIPPDANFVYFTAYMLDCAASHSHTATMLLPRRYSTGVFYGIMIDTECANASTCGKSQYLAYCTHVGVPPRIDQSTIGRCKFGAGSADSKGVARIRFPFDGALLSFNVHVVDAGVLLLLSFADMDALKLQYDNLKDTIVHEDTRSSDTVTSIFGHPFYVWHPLIENLYTEVESAAYTVALAIRVRIK